jgi:hydrogenase maturation protease
MGEPGTAGDGTAAPGGPIVVIGVGNEFRRDDGIGPEVLSRLHGRTADGVRLVASDGEPARMIEAWTGASLAVVIDAVLVHPPVPGRLHRIMVDRADCGDIRPVSSHGLGLGDSIALGRALGRMPDRLIVHAVEAADVGQGIGLTPAVAAATDALITAVLSDVNTALA